MVVVCFGGGVDVGVDVHVDVGIAFFDLVGVDVVDDYCDVVVVLVGCAMLRVL